MDVLEGDVEITEFEAIDVESVKGVRQGANGFPILLMKGLAKADADGDDDGDVCKTCGGKGTIMDGHRDCPDCDGPASKAVGADGQIDEGPDIDIAGQILKLIGQAIGSEASEVGAGHPEELDDVHMLARAGEIVSCWQAREQAVADGQDPNAACGCCSWCEGIGCGCCPGCGTGALMCAAAKAKMSTSAINDLPDSAFAYIEPGGEKDADGKTTPRSKRHFPVHDKAHADNAAARIAQGAEFGDEAKPKVEAAQRKFGESDDDASKGAAVAEGGTSVQTEALDDSQIAKAVADAVTKAVAPLQERIESLSGELAKVKATPIPGGLVLSANARPQQGAAQDGEWTAKAAQLHAKADAAISAQERDGYRQLARQAEERARQPIAT